MLLLKLRIFTISVIMSVGLLFYSDFNSDKFVVNSTKDFKAQNQIIALVVRQNY